MRRRSSTNISPTTHSLSRARSTSVSLLRGTVVHAASAVAAATGSPVAGVVRRARSGTVLSKESEYSQVTGDDEDEDELEEDIGAKEQLKLGMGMGTSAALSRDKTEWGLGQGQGQVSRRSQLGLGYPKSTVSMAVPATEARATTA
jgi:hypothetical protein